MLRSCWRASGRRRQRRSSKAPSEVKRRPRGADGRQKGGGCSARDRARERLEDEDQVSPDDEPQEQGQQTDERPGDGEAGGLVVRPRRPPCLDTKDQAEQ